MSERTPFRVVNRSISAPVETAPDRPQWSVPMNTVIHPEPRQGRSVHHCP
jgi:hypothetical protein